MIIQMISCTPPQTVREFKIVHSFREANESNRSSSEANIMKFRNLKKKATLGIDPPAIATPFVS